MAARWTPASDLAELHQQGTFVLADAHDVGSARLLVDEGRDASEAVGTDRQLLARAGRAAGEAT